MFCPEHGTKIRIAYNGYNICYDCPRGEHWFYDGDRGEYTVTSRASCPQADKHPKTHVVGER